MFHLKALLLNLILLLIGNGCCIQQTTDLPVVYTSIYPLYDFTCKIGGEQIKVHNLTPPGIEPHSFEPSPQQIVNLGQADLFLYNGANMEPYLDKLKANLTNQPVHFAQVTTNIQVLNINQETDPHFWLSPQAALIIGENILQELSTLDPSQQTIYEKNFANFKSQIESLDLAYQETLATAKKQKIIVTHPAFNYLCQNYQLTSIPILGLNPEAEPTAQKLKEICQILKEEKIKYLFTANFYSPQVADTLAYETGAQVLPLHPLGTLTQTELNNGEDYFTIMRTNLDNLAIALECEL